MNLSLVATFLVLVSASASAREVCCPDLGCFTDDPPFQYMPLPDCIPGDFEVSYTMYSRDNPDVGQTVTRDIVPAAFKGQRRTVFISHGYIADSEYKWMTNLKNAFLKREDIQVVVIDWGQGAFELYYPQAASNTRVVGANTALVIQNLLRQPFTDPVRFWCVGHSLGSHVCGHTGMKMPLQLQIGRITGLDPAGPSFQESDDLTIGLNPTAAQFVDIIHTDIALGNENILGHIDFFPTGYQYQFDFSFTSAFEIGFICGSVCMHHRSIDFMMDSLLGKSDCFATNYQCTTQSSLPGSCSTDASCTAYMGYRAQESCSKTGIHYLKVPKAPVFCPRA